MVQQTLDSNGNQGGGGGGATAVGSDTSRRRRVHMLHSDFVAQAYGTSITGSSVTRYFAGGGAGAFGKGVGTVVQAAAVTVMF